MLLGLALLYLVELLEFQLVVLNLLQDVVLIEVKDLCSVLQGGCFVLLTDELTVCRVEIDRTLRGGLPVRAVLTLFMDHPFYKIIMPNLLYVESFRKY